LIQNKKDKTLLYIVAGLSAILVLLFIFFMVEKSKNRKHIQSIQQEKEILETELTELSYKYDDLKTANDTLNEKLDLEQEKIATLLEEMRTFRNNSYAEINRYKKEIGTLYDVLRSYVVQIDSLNQLNQKLLAENTQVKQQSEWLRERNQNLESQQKNMQEVIKLASALTTENFTVVPINKNGREVNWKKCFQLRADFVVPRNITTKRGSRTVYLRIKRPDDKVIAFSEKSFFKYQNVSLTYSAKRDIDYEGERIEASIYWPNDGSLISGKYIAELFCDNENIGSTEFFLK
ncbi:MAG: hypothetical protein LIO65_04190, partial [Odoribacter sp.]|nr:hypothetical protein [Odoribacter sp.]